MKVGDKVRYGNGEWCVESVGPDTVTITQFQRDWSGEGAVAVATVVPSQVEVVR